jgi:hypothetical protein
MIYIFHHFKTITNYYLPCIFLCIKEIFDMPTNRKGIFQNVSIRSCHNSNFMGKIKSLLIYSKTLIRYQHMVSLEEKYVFVTSLCN